MSDYTIPWSEEDISISISTDPPSESMDPFLTLFAEVTTRCPELCETLDDFSSISLAPTEYHHITIKQIGEYNEDIEGISEEIKEAVSDIDPFEVKLQGADIFPNCIYVPVIDDDEKLRELHETICEIESLSIDGYEGDSYTPHMTVGKFTEQPEERLFDVLEDFRDTDWGTMRIESIHLVKDGTQSVGPFTTFQSVEQFDLESLEDED